MRARQPAAPRRLSRSMTGAIIQAGRHTGTYYVVEKPLGSGASGLVYAVTQYNATTREVVNADLAIKLVPLFANETHLLHTSRELLHLNKLHGHPHIISVTDIVTTNACVGGASPVPGPAAIGIVMPRAKRTLQDYLKGTTDFERTALYFFKPLILAVHYCHHRGVYQRDIKPSNLLLFKDTPESLIICMLCDLGWSTDILQARSPNPGTLGYQAPEIARGQIQYDAAQVDVWSCGVVLLQMLFPHTFAAVQRRLQDNLAREGAAPVLWVDWRRELKDAMRVGGSADNWAVSEDCYELLEGMLQMDPKRRAPLSWVMGHRWFRQGLPADLDLVAFNQNVQHVPPLLDEHVLKEWVRVNIWHSVWPGRLPPKAELLLSAQPPPAPAAMAFPVGPLAPAPDDDHASHRPRLKTGFPI